MAFPTRPPAGPYQPKPSAGPDQLGILMAKHMLLSINISHLEIELLAVGKVISIIC